MVRSGSEVDLMAAARVGWGGGNAKEKRRITVRGYGDGRRSLEKSTWSSSREAKGVRTGGARTKSK